MLCQCVLETDGYRVLFELKSLESSKKSVDIVAEFQLDKRLGAVSAKSIPALDTIKNLQRLIMYFEKHIARLEKDPDSESNIFLTYGFGFQLQVFSGEVRSPDDGEFSLRFMVNVGQSHEQASKTFVGGEAEVTLEQINKFTASLQLALTELSCAELQKVVQ